MAAHRLCVLSRQLSPAPASAVDDDDDAAITMQLGADGKFKPGVGARYVHVKGAEAVRFVLSQGRTFSSVPPRIRMFPAAKLRLLRGTPMHSFALGMRNWAVNSDAPLHGALRAAMPKHLMVYAAVDKEHRAAVEAAVARLLDAVEARRGQPRSFDIMEDVTKPLSALMLCRVLGVRDATAARCAAFRRWATVIASSSDSIEMGTVLRMGEAHGEGVAYFLRAVAYIRARAAAGASHADAIEAAAAVVPGVSGGGSAGDSDRDSDSGSDDEQEEEREDDEDPLEQAVALRARRALAQAELGSGFDREGVLWTMVTAPPCASADAGANANAMAPDELLANQFMMWVIGGFHNPANLGGLLVGMALAHPAQLRLLRAEAAAGGRTVQRRLLHCAASEVMRVVSPADVIVRVATADAVLPPDEAARGADAGAAAAPRRVLAGDNLILHLQAANHGMCPVAAATTAAATAAAATAHEAEHGFNMARPLEDSGRHLGFGFGPHRCLGGMFGHLQAECVMEALLLERPAFRRTLRLEHPFAFEVAGSFKELPELRATF